MPGAGARNARAGACSSDLACAPFFSHEEHQESQRGFRETIGMRSMDPLPGSTLISGVVSFVLFVVSRFCGNRLERARARTVGSGEGWFDDWY